MGGIPIIVSDLIDEPGQLGSYAAIEEFRARKSMIRALLEQPRVSVSCVFEEGTTGTQTLDVRALVQSDLRYKVLNLDRWPYSSGCVCRG